MAAAAGVSTGTVSNVLNRPERVSAETRSRVEGAMRLLEYRRNGAAARLSTGTSGLFAAVLPDVRNPFWTSVLAGAEHRLAASGASLVVATAGHSVRDFQQVVHRLEQYGIDGVLVATAPTARHLDVCRDSSLHVVVAGADGRSRGVSSVCVDDRAGMRLAGQHLVQLGHDRIALLNGPTGRVWCARRRRGVVDALVAHGLDARSALVDVTVERMDVECGRAVAGEVAELRGEQHVTAVACANDLLAIGLVGALGAAGVTVPTDLSLTGFDDIPAARWTAPTLTTVRQDPAIIGTTAIDLLVARAPDEHVVIAPELVVRASAVSR